MKICVAQIKSNKGDIKENRKNHNIWINIAVSEKVDLIIFPELSLTGYEPELAKELAIDPNDFKIDDFQKTSDLNKITIGVGLPTKSENGIRISMVIFQPLQPPITYHKQNLHSDELPYFTQGNEQLVFTVNKTKIAPAICYESLQPEHSEKAKKMSAEIYVASVAKSQGGIEKALSHFSKIAKKFSMPILMANCIGYCDNFQSVGQSAVWNENGTLVGQLSSEREGLLIFDTETEELIKREKATNRML